MCLRSNGILFRLRDISNGLPYIIKKGKHDIPREKPTYSNPKKSDEKEEGKVLTAKKQVISNLE